MSRLGLHSPRRGKGQRQTPCKTQRRIPGCVLLVLLSAAWSVPAGICAGTEDLGRGEHLARAAGCLFCHTDTEHDGPALAGGRRIETDFGIFYTPNITPDRETGIGAWSDEDFLRALREGIGPEGSYYPVFPYTAYTQMSDADILSLKEYLFAQPAVARQSLDHDLPWFLSWRGLLELWTLLYFQPGAFEPDPGRTVEWNRGAYLANAVTHCAECHSPRTWLGGIDEDLRYAGTRSGPEGGVVPNITPDRKTGIGRWDRDELVDLLDSGALPDGDYVGGAMADVVDEMTSHLTSGERENLVTFLLSLSPLQNDVRSKRDTDR